MADWSRAYTASWRVRRVDPASWECVADVAGVTSATVSRDVGSLMESADLSLSLGPGESVAPGWVRIEAVVEQDGGAEVVPVSTVMLTEGGATFARGLRDTQAKGLSVLWPASVRHFARGTTAPKGTDGAAWVARLLASCIDAPVAAEGGFELSDHVVFTSGQTYLDGALQVLAAAGWRLRVDGRGEVTVCAPATEPALEVTPASVADGIKLDADLSDVPNAYVAVDGAEVARAYDEDPASPTSTVSRGYVVEVADTAPKRVDGESLDGYARRKLDELRTRAVRSYSWRRDFAPGIVPGDLVRARVPQASLDAVLRVSLQTLRCGSGMTLEESAALEEVV